MIDAARFRAEFPVFERVSYLNAGTEGPLSRRAAEAGKERIEAELAGGRAGKVYFEGIMDLAARLRAAYAGVLHCPPESVALTGSTTDGVNTVIAGLDLHAGEEILTSDEEHPGLLAPLARAQRRHGIIVRVAPFAELAAAVTPATRLVATSHVSWVSGRLIDDAGLRATGVPFLLDAAQGIGAVPVDVATLGCTYYAASGQKWLSGPEGSGCLYVAPEALDELTVPWPGYGSLADPKDALRSGPAETAKRLDLGFPPGLRSTWARPRWPCCRRPAGSGCMPARRISPRNWPPISPSAGSWSVRAIAPPWCPGTPRIPMPRSAGSPRPASSCAASRRTATCGPRSGPGPPRRSSPSWPGWRQRPPERAARRSGRACRRGQPPIRSGRV